MAASREAEVSAKEKPAPEITVDTEFRAVNEKERNAFEKKLKERQRAALASVTRCRNELVSEMADESNLHKVKSELEKFNELSNVYQNIYAERCEVIVDDELLDKESKRFNEKQQSILTFRKEVKSWINDAEQKLSDEIEIKSQHSNSNQVRELC